MITIIRWYDTVIPSLAIVLMGFKYHACLKDLLNWLRGQHLHCAKAGNNVHGFFMRETQS